MIMSSDRQSRLRARLCQVSAGWFSSLSFCLGVYRTPGQEGFPNLFLVSSRELYLHTYVFQYFTNTYSHTHSRMITMLYSILEPLLHQPLGRSKAPASQNNPG